MYYRSILPVSSEIVYYSSTKYGTEAGKMDPKTISFMANWIILMAPLVKWWVKTLILQK